MTRSQARRILAQYTRYYNRCQCSGGRAMRLGRRLPHRVHRAAGRLE